MSRWATVSRAVRAAARDWAARRAERRLWEDVPDVAHLQELMARFCEGDLSEWPGHGGPRAEETVEIAPSLAAANRRGFITTGSQPGYDDGEGDEQRAAVSGLATPAVVAQLQGLVAGTRLVLYARSAPRWRTDASTSMLVSRTTGIWHPELGEPITIDHTDFGAVVTRRQLRFEFQGVPAQVVRQLTQMQQVTIIDPVWGEHDLLWRRLDEPDWDNPAPPPSLKEAATVAKKTDMQVVREEYERLARRIAEEEIRRGIPQFAGGAPEVSLVELRKALSARRVPWTRQDAALEELAFQDGVHVRARADQHNLTDADWRAGVRFGGDTRHSVMIEPEFWSAPPPKPPPTAGAASGGGTPSGTSSGASTAGQITVFADLYEPGIDPHEYGTQLPDQFGQVAALLRKEEKELADHAECVRGKAACLSAYIDYMTDAQVDINVLTRLEAALEVYEAIGGVLSAQAEEAREAAHWMDLAQQDADAVYGGQAVPRFDQAG